MSCSVCNKVIPITDPSKNGLQYSLKSESTPISGPLFAPAKAPRGGWYFELYLRGHVIKISKRKPSEVAAEVARLLDLNEILYTPAQLWLNLNIQWVGRAVEKYQKVRLPHLLALATPNF